MTTSALVSIPEGFDDIDVTDIDKLSRNDPERCMMFLDVVMKDHALEIRKRWIAKAQILYFVEERKLWQHHPAGFTSTFQWARQPEIDLAAGTVSEMLAMVRFAPEIKETCDIDIFEMIEEVGISNVRLLIPAMRKASRNGTMREEVSPLLDVIQGASFREVLKMVTPGGQRTVWDPEVIYEEIDSNEGEGLYNITFRNLTFDQMELLDEKAGHIKRWYDKKGYRIDPPLNALSDEPRHDPLSLEEGD